MNVQLPANPQNRLGGVIRSLFFLVKLQPKIMENDPNESQLWPAGRIQPSEPSCLAPVRSIVHFFYFKKEAFIVYVWKCLQTGTPSDFLLNLLNY